LCLALAAACVFDRSGIDLGNSNNANLDGGKPDAACENGDARCSGTVLEVCGSGGWAPLTDCPLGCNDLQLRCNRIRPSNNIDPTWVDEGQNPFDPQASVLVNTQTGDIDPPPLSFPFWTVGPYQCGQSGSHTMEAMVFGFSEIHIPAGVTVRIVGTRAAVFLASGPVLIEGIIELSGGRDACPEHQELFCAGPGGFEGGRSAEVNPQSGFGPGGGGGGYSDNPIVNDETGGGGGGHAAAGGWGGNESPGTLPGGRGGEWYGNPTIEPLCGGSGGGGGGGGVSGGMSSHGGGGGGAIQILSATSIVIDCSSGPCGIHASGAGGQADHHTNFDDGGGGGGAGGAILLEAPSVTVGDHAYLVAGGGGGAGGYNNGADCNDGQNGPFARQRAAGGFGNFSGGDGGGADVGPGDHGDAGDDGTAGGGGSAGWIRINHNNDADFRGTTSPDATGLFTFGLIQTD
jgi:hypothetical protein